MSLPDLTNAPTPALMEFLAKALVQLGKLNDNGWKLLDLRSEAPIEDVAFHAKLDQIIAENDALYDELRSLYDVVSSEVDKRIASM